MKAGNDTELLNCLSEPLTFGTAGRMSFYHLKCDDEIGLRAAMGAGFARMNQLTVIQATQGVCMYLLSPQSTCDVLQQGVVIGYDHRHHSQEFALLAASVFLDKRVPVHLYPSIVPTPFIVRSLLVNINLPEAAFCCQIFWSCVWYHDYCLTQSQGGQWV